MIVLFKKIDVTRPPLGLKSVSYPLDFRFLVYHLVYKNFNGKPFCNENQLILKGAFAFVELLAVFSKLLILLLGEWLFNFNQSPAAIMYGPPSLKPDVTIKIDDEDFDSLAKGKLNAMQAFMQGKLKAKGQLMLAQKLGDLFKDHASKL